MKTIGVPLPLWGPRAGILRVESQNFLPLESFAIERQFEGLRNQLLKYFKALELYFGKVTQSLSVMYNFNFNCFMLTRKDQKSGWILEGSTEAVSGPGAHVGAWQPEVS